MGRRWIHRNTLWYTLRGVLGLDPGSDRGRVRVGHHGTPSFKDPIGGLYMHAYA